MRQAIRVGRANAIRDTGSDRIFTLVNTGLLTIGALVILYPLVFVVSASFSSPHAVMSGQVVLLPVEFNVEAYERIFEYREIRVGFANSLFYASVGSLINVAMTLTAGYALSRKDLYGRGVIMALFLFTMMFNGGLIPTYMVVKDVGLLNTRWALIVPQALSVWNLVITVAYFRTSVPMELLEAAQIDGAGDIEYFVKVALPLCRPIVAVLFLFYAVAHWNQFFAALLYLGRPDLFPLQVILRQILIQSQIDQEMIADVMEMQRRAELVELIKYALIVVASVPVLVIYPLVQRHFVKGMMLGAVKG